MSSAASGDNQAPRPVALALGVGVDVIRLHLSGFAGPQFGIGRPAGALGQLHGGRRLGGHTRVPHPSPAARPLRCGEQVSGAAPGARERPSGPWVSAPTSSSRLGRAETGTKI